MTSDPRSTDPLPNARRNLLKRSGAGVAAAIGLAAAGTHTAADAAIPSQSASRGPLLRNATNTLKMKDGTKLFFKDWGTGTPVVFSHGWPLCADAWDAQLLFIAERGYRVIAHDRRGHGRSTQTWNGNDMSTYADDLATLMDALDLKQAVMVGHSTGGGEVARYIGRHGEKRVAKAVLVSSVPPHMAKTPGNPEGMDIAIFDGLRNGVRADRSQTFRDVSVPFFGTNRPGAKPFEGLRESFWLQGMLGGEKPLYDCIKAFSETDFTEDLQKMTVPTLFVHGDDDQIVPIDVASKKAVKLVKNGTLKIYPGAPHGLPLTHGDLFNDDLLAFIKS